MKDISVMQAKRFGIYSCGVECSLKDAAKVMTERNISALVVVNDAGSLEGIITRTDLVRICYRYDDWANWDVSECMSRDVVTVQLDDTLGHVMELLIEKHIHRVVAIREGDDLIIPVGILSAADIVYHMAREE